MTQPLFVTGMFRSGTTLLAKMLDAHGRICCANDPYLPIFKAFRNVVERDLVGDAPDPNRPLDDYYFDERSSRLMQAVQSASFAREIDSDTLASLREAVRGYAAEFSPEVAARADALEGETFTDVLRSAFSIVRESYGSAESKVAAFKTAWTDEFAGHVLDALPDARVIHILRDPRAVCASKNARPDKYPWLFLIRQWRKLAVFTWLAGQKPSWRDRLLMIRYEDLIAQPEDWAEKIAAFLGIDPDPAMADARTFRDTGGGQWGGNSSHFENVYAFNRASADKWRRALEPREIAYIEHLCLPEMGIFGYEPTVEVTPEIPEALAFDPPRVPEDSLAKWIRPYEITSPEALIREMALESLRYRAIWSASALSDELATLLFLDPAFHRAIKRPAAAQAEA